MLPFQETLSLSWGCSSRNRRSSRSPRPPVDQGDRWSDYLQPGVSTVCPGGWHLALASFGPPPLLPGPNDGSAIAAGASAPSTASVVTAKAMRFFMGSSNGSVERDRQRRRNADRTPKEASSLGTFVPVYEEVARCR